MNVNIINMSEVENAPVKWLWYPYMPYGKITLIQGDPGDGKTTLEYKGTADCVKTHNISKRIIHNAVVY